MEPEVTVIGDVNADILVPSLASIPEKDSQTLTENLILCSGGCAGNFAKALGKLNCRVRLIAKIGNDLWRDFLEKEFTGIETCFSYEDKTGTTLVLSYNDQRRTFLTCPGANALLKATEIDPDKIEGTCLHITSFFSRGMREDTLDLIGTAKEKGMIITCDPGWDPDCWGEEDRQLARKIIGHVDIVFANIKEGKAITGTSNIKDICQEMLKLGAQNIALKAGKNGCYVARDGFFSAIPAKKVATVDTTGAGDVFDASFVWEFLRSKDIMTSGKFANIKAAHSTKEYGSGRRCRRI